MNIFVTDSNPYVCAQALDDLRLNKMILETAQLLSTALRFHHTSMDVYKSTHVNHPCSVWTRTSQGNYNWLLQHFVALVGEKATRTGKIHKSYDLCTKFADGVRLIPSGDLTPFVNCTPYKNLDVFDAYQLTLRDKWAADKRPPKWTKSNSPSWA